MYRAYYIFSRYGILVCALCIPLSRGPHAGRVVDDVGNLLYGVRGLPVLWVLGPSIIKSYQYNRVFIRKTFENNFNLQWTITAESFHQNSYQNGNSSSPLMWRWYQFI